MYSTDTIKDVRGLMIDGLDVGTWFSSEATVHAASNWIRIERDGIDISKCRYPFHQYSTAQQSVILSGLVEGVDITKFDDPDRYDAAQMVAVLYGLMYKYDISQYNHPEKYTAAMMSDIMMSIRTEMTLQEHLTAPSLRSLQDIHDASNTQ